MSDTAPLALEPALRRDEPAQADLHPHVPLAPWHGHAGVAQLVSELPHAAHVLPAQGPIGVFVHHNTLHAYQDKPFEEAVVEAARDFGAEPFMPESSYRDALARGRITAADVDAVLAALPNIEGVDPVLRRAVRRSMLLHGVEDDGGGSLRWRLDEGGLLRALPPNVPAEARARLVEAALAQLRPVVAAGDLARAGDLLTGAGELARARDVLACRTGLLLTLPALRSALDQRNEALAAAMLWTSCAQVAGTRTAQHGAEPRGDDRLDAVGAFMARLCAAFLDQGVADLELPERQHGLWRAFRALVIGGPLPARWMAPLRDVLATREDVRAAAQWALDELDLEPSTLPRALRGELLALPGWAGMIHRLEHQPALAPHVRVPASLLEYVVIRLLLRTVAPADETPRTRRQDPLLAWSLYGACAGMGRFPWQEGTHDTHALLEEVAAFHAVERRRTWHLAYEHHHRDEVLHALAATPMVARARADVQVVTCIDEREEAFRRHLEEQGQHVETLGAAGFFAVAMNYRGLDDAESAAYCPVVVTPEHEVHERPRPGDEHAVSTRAARRQVWARVMRAAGRAAGGLVSGWAWAWLAAVPALVAIVARVLVPRHAAAWRRAAAAAVFPPVRTSLGLDRSVTAEPGAGRHLGFTREEQATRVARLLEDMGILRRLSPLVVLLGHGSTSLNNPHESAHDCGACGGRRGGNNARAFAQLANHPEVRALLAARGTPIPDGTWFVGGYHDTSSDEVTLADTDVVPASHADALARARAMLDRARMMSAHERARRFHAAGANPSPEAALAHVEDRAATYSEPRPEYGHCTNAVCIVGRRDRTRGLFMDRRSFLVSYDPTTDADGAVLARILGAVGPVGAGINLEYYFSYVDNERYGCGTKLPHNVTGLLGVTNGHGGDLRTGLPWQMVELHEPVRLLLVVETTPDVILGIAARNAEVRELVVNGWIRLALQDPATGTLQVFEGGAFKPLDGTPVELKRVASSTDWYTGSREFLPPALVTRGRTELAA